MDTLRNGAGHTLTVAKLDNISPNQTGNRPAELLDKLACAFEDQVLRMKRLEEKFDTLLAEVTALRGTATSRQSAGMFGVVGDDWTW